MTGDITSSDLLARLVASRGLQPEPVATETLTHLLASSKAARIALENVATVVCPHASFEGLVFSGQAVQAESQGRPDLVGRDATAARMVIEAKFDAALTPSQTGTGYLDWLPQGQPGVLLYLVPANRMPAIWPLLLAGPCERPIKEIAPPSLAHADEPWLSELLGDGRVVAAMSWESLMNRMHAALSGEGDPVASSDLQQLQGLVQAQLRTGWVPLAPGDLPDRSGLQLLGLVDATIRAASAVSTKKLTNATQDLGPGRWVATSSGRSFRVGVDLRAWAKFGFSPIWATVWTNDALKRNVIHDCLKELNQPGGPGVYAVDDLTWGVPVRLTYGTEVGQVSAEMAQQFTVISDLLNAIPASSGEVTQPDVETLDEGGS